MSVDQGFANETGFDVSSVLASISSNLVKVIHGSAGGDHPLGGHTVAVSRSSLSAAYSIPGDAKAMVNGRAVAEDYVLRPGESLEFRKEAGVKG